MLLIWLYSNLTTVLWHVTHLAVFHSHHNIVACHSPGCIPISLQYCGMSLTWLYSMSLTYLYSNLTTILRHVTHLAILQSHHTIVACHSPGFTPISPQYCGMSLTWLYSNLTTILWHVTHLAVLQSHYNIVSCYSPGYTPFPPQYCGMSLTYLYSNLTTILWHVTHLVVLQSHHNIACHSPGCTPVSPQYCGMSLTWLYSIPTTILWHVTHLAVFQSHHIIVTCYSPGHTSPCIPLQFCWRSHSPSHRSGTLQQCNQALQVCVQVTRTVQRDKVHTKVLRLRTMSAILQSAIQAYVLIFCCFVCSVC
jgi:hypothetical protein